MAKITDTAKGLCSIIQFHNARTRETINIGFAYNDGDHIYLYAPISHPSIMRYLRMHSPETIVYGIEVLAAMLQRTPALDETRIGKHLSMNEPFPVETRGSGKEAAKSLAATYLSIDTDPFEEELMFIFNVH